MHYSSLVAEKGALQQLVQDVLHLLRLHRLPQLVQILLHVLIEVLKDQEQAVALKSMLDLLQAHNIRVVAQLLQDSNLTNGCARNSIVAMVYLYLFHRYDLIGALLDGLIDNTISALT